MRYVVRMSRNCSNKQTDEGGQRPTTLAIQVTIMFIKSAAEKTLDQATAVLDEVKRTYQPQIDAGTLTDTDRERIGRRLKLAADLAERSRSESDVAFFGDVIRMGRRFFKTGRFGMTNEELTQELLALRSRAEAVLLGVQVRD